MFIQTVAGRLEPRQLGFCQCHEHLWITAGESGNVNPALCIDDEENSLNELIDYRGAGGHAVVDAQPVGCGRDARRLCKLSLKSGVSIIGSTGFHKLVFYPGTHWINHCDVDWLSALFIRELRCGMVDSCDTGLPENGMPTEIRAGQIKTALDTENLTPRYRRLFQAAAQAAVQTGAPLMVHVESSSNPLVLAEFLIGLGVQPQSIIFCHLDRAEPDLSVHKQLCELGAYLEYDTIGREKYHSDHREIEIIKEMLAGGYSSQLLMSLDVTRQRLLRYGGQIGLTYIRHHFMPMMEKAGVSQEHLHKIFISNPSKAFSFTEV